MYSVRPLLLISGDVYALLFASFGLTSERDFGKDLKIYRKVDQGAFKNIPYRN